MDHHTAVVVYYLFFKLVLLKTARERDVVKRLSFCV